LYNCLDKDYQTSKNQLDQIFPISTSLLFQQTVESQTE